jgi:host factor-I protein
LPGNLPSQTLGTPTSVGQVTQAGILPYRASFQSGTYALGAPRQFEFGLKVDF